MEQRKEAIICLEGLGKQFQTTNGTVTALDDINLEILQGEIFGIIGLSGAGKSTLVRCINYLETPTAGRVIFEGQNLSMMKESEIRKARQSMGMIFQQFNLLAQRNVLQNVCFPMEIAGVPKAEAKKRAAELLKLVGLEERMKAYPAQLSGGQKQRVAIARAMSTNPKVLLCDEATSALDVSVQKQILDLIREHVEESGCSVLFICHDLALAESFGDRIAVMYRGRIVEWLNGNHLKREALHPYTRLLLDSVFSIHDEPDKPIPFLPEEGGRSGLDQNKNGRDGTLESMGCAFCARCEKADEECRKKRPELNMVSPGHFVACLKIETQR